MRYPCKLKEYEYALVERSERQCLKRGNSTMETQQATATHPPTSPTAAGGRAVQPASRWYYLDWLCVLAILIVFLFHITKIFNDDFFR
jgi:hypothetical protein